MRVAGQRSALFAHRESGHGGTCQPQRSTAAGVRPASLRGERWRSRLAWSPAWVRMRPLLEARLVNDVFGDPALYVAFVDERRALLFDLGDLSALRPRDLLRLSQVFVTHAHMDHFAGFDQLLRVLLGRKPRLQIFGGPEFAAQVEHKLRAYTWNVVHRYEVELLLEVCELAGDGHARWARFSSRRGFAREEGPTLALAGDVLHEEAAFRVRGRFVDHGIPCLAYALEEKARLRVASERLAALGVTTGAWLG